MSAKFQTFVLTLVLTVIASVSGNGSAFFSRSAPKLYLRQPYYGHQASMGVSNRPKDEVHRHSGYFGVSNPEFSDKIQSANATVVKDQYEQSVNAADNWNGTIKRYPPGLSRSSHHHDPIEVCPSARRYHVRRPYYSRYPSFKKTSKYNKHNSKNKKPQNFYYDGPTGHKKIKYLRGPSRKKYPYKAYPHYRKHHVPFVIQISESNRRKVNDSPSDLQAPEAESMLTTFPAVTTARYSPGFTLISEDQVPDVNGHFKNYSAYYEPISATIKPIVADQEESSSGEYYGTRRLTNTKLPSRASPSGLKYAAKYRNQEPFFD